MSADLSGFNGMDKPHWTEKRQFRRVPTDSLARYRIVSGRDPGHVSQVLTGTVANVGGGGVLLQVDGLTSSGLHISFDDDVDVQNWVAVEFQLPSGGAPIRAMARVAWYQRGVTAGGSLYDVGLQFEEIRPEDRQRILDYVTRERPG